MNKIDSYRFVRWTVTYPKGRCSVHKRLVPAEHVNRLQSALVLLYDKRRPRQQVVGCDPRQKLIAAPDLRATLRKIEVGTPTETEGFWWTSPTLQSDQQRARIVDWDWEDTWPEQPEGETARA